jgi:orotidine-5'-phosphate decarboxylase
VTDSLKRLGLELKGGLMTNFDQFWLETVAKRNSILCIGVDPADTEMGRTDKGEGLPAGVDKRDWTLGYIEKTAKYASGAKWNTQYWMRNDHDIAIMNESMGLAESLGLVVIQDSKLADIGSTNDAGIFNAALRAAHAVTLAPYAGNMGEAAKQCNERGIAGITMCLMSNPEYKFVKNMWFDVSANVSEYHSRDVHMIEDVPHVRNYIALARQADKFGLDAVIGAPSSKNHITEEEISNASRYLASPRLVLVPGIGAQGGEVAMLKNYFAASRIIANVGRACMFPDPRKAYATPEDQADAAKHYQSMLNELRLAA